MCTNLGYDTRFDSRVRGMRGTYGAQWMEDNYHVMFNDWPSTRAESQSETGDRFNFMNRVEKSLQYAVEAVAAALTWVIDTHLAYHKKLECGCGDLTQSTKSKLVQKLISDYLFVSLWLVVGYLASILTFSLTLSPFATH